MSASFFFREDMDFSGGKAVAQQDRHLRRAPYVMLKGLLRHGVPASNGNSRTPGLTDRRSENIITSYKHKKANSSKRNCLPNILSCLLRL